VRPLTVRVIDGTTQQHVAGAQVKARFWTRKGESREKFTTDDQGQCVIRVPQPQPEYVGIAVEAAGYVPVLAGWENRDFPPKHEVVPEQFVFPLQEGTSIGGTVINEDGEPVEGVKVYLLLTGEEGKIKRNIGEEQYATTDADGRWRSDILPENIDGLWMNLKHPDYVNTDVWNTVPVPPVKALRDLSSVMVVKRGITVSGVVRDENGSPIAGALVQLGGGGCAMKSTRTNKDGRFELRNCEKGAEHVSVQARRKSPEIRRVSADEIVQPLAFTLKPGHSICIRVVDKYGTPIQGVAVDPANYKGYRNLLGMSLGFGRSRETDKNGVVVWDAAPADAVEYDFYKDGYAWLDEVALVADGEEHTVTLPRPIKVSGTVVDKQTGEPIDKFRVVPVLDWLTGRTPTVSRSGAFESEGGRYEWLTQRTDTGHYVRIEADGYVPAMSEMFRVGEAEEKTIDFHLERGKNIEGIVRGTDAHPAEGAEVLMCTPMQYVYLSNGKMRDPDWTYLCRTKADGRYSFPPEREPFMLVVLHEDGYAEATHEQLAASPDVTIQPWGRIEGRLVRNGEPVASYPIRMFPIHVGTPSEPDFFPQYYAATDETGAFAFERVSPGAVRLSPDLGPWREYELTSSELIPLVVKPGQTVRVSLGDTGRPLVGKVVLPPGVEREMHWEYGLNYLVAMEDGIPVPDEIKDLGFDWRQGWNETWTATPEGRAYFETLRRYFVKLNPDGTFRVDGVPAGQYQLVIRAYDPPEGMGCLVNPIATAVVDVTVPPATTKEVSEPAELGAVVVKLCPVIAEGNQAPLFEVEALDGGTIKLSDYRGKVVLLDFWATSCGPCVAAIPTLKSLFKEFGKNERFAMISLSLDTSIEDARQFVKEKGMGWIQGYLGDWSETDLPSQYSISYLPSMLIIGADGSIVADKVRGPDVREKLREALDNATD